MRRLVFLLLLGLAACRSGTDRAEGVSSHLEGTVAVADTVRDILPENFSVLVFHETEGRTDTLGWAPVSPDGTFALGVTAPDRGVYPLVLSYEGQPLRLDELVVAGGDSATVHFSFPITSRRLRIRSRENDAWTAYRNAKAHYDGDVRQAVGADDALARIRNATLQTSSILWSLRDGYPGTVAEEMGAAESIVLLDGWDDSLLVVRAGEIPPQSAGFVTVAQAARRAEARLRGQGAAIRLLEAFMARTDSPEKQAALQAEIVTARLDSLQADAAQVAARDLQTRFPDSPWATWAERAEYEATTLMPGLPAPRFTATTDRGRTVALDSLRGQFVVLEFFTPGNEGFRQQIDARIALEQALRTFPVRFVSVSLDRDSLLTRAFFSQVAMSHARIEAPEGLGSPLARQFNVHALPTRYLIDPEGIIRAKYVGPLVPQLMQDLLTLLRAQIESS